MSKGWIRNLGPIKGSVAVTLFTVPASMAVYALVSFIIGEFRPLGVFMSALIPAIIAPLISYIFFKFMHQFALTQGALRESEDRLRAILDFVQAGIFIIDPEDQTIVEANPMAVKMIGLPRKQIEGRIGYDFISGVGLNQKADDLESTLITADGREIPIIKTEVQVKLSGRDRLLATFVDITNQKKAEAELQRAYEELQRLATMDGLTQIANRRSFDEHFTKEWGRLRRAKNPLALIMGDIDFFKSYNDTYGHQMGDECLKAVARTLSQCIQRPGDLVARYGGEEYTVILSNTSLEGAVHVAENMRRQIEELEILHKSSSISRYVTLSLGVSAMVPDLESNPNDLLEVVDKALYQAKDQGRNRVVAKSFKDDSLDPARL
ncbi:MAG: sensor domain-containing diguanylate cyclase [Pseudomonadota bacterium]